jgi:hypothetical protein
MGELATMGFKGSWNFKRGNGAVLVMKRPTMTILKYEVAVAAILKSLPELNGKALLTGMYTCPQYVLAMYNSKESSVGAAAAAGIPPHIIIAGSAEMGTSWKKWTGGGVLKSGGEGEEHKEDQFMPLLRLKYVKERNFFRLRGDPLEGKQTEFEDFPVPWKSLDEQGNEGEEDDDMF